jgi:hypothetical protein
VALEDEAHCPADGQRSENEEEDQLDRHGFTALISPSGQWPDS